MSNPLSAELKSEIFKQESSDPFLTLITLTGPGIEYRLVNNTKDITSNGQLFTAFPMKIRLPVDDGESAREFQIEFDNVSLLLIRALRSVTQPIECRIDMILASLPDVIQMSVEDLLIRSIMYDEKKISAKIVLDNFLAVAMPAEKYTPSLYPGLF